MRYKSYVPLRLFLPALMLLAGAYLLIDQFLYFSQARASANWPVVEAEVISAKEATQIGIVRDRLSDAMLMLLPQVPNFSLTPSRLSLNYKYSVGGKTFAGDNYQYGKDPFGERQIQIDHQYPVGSVLPVCYNPGHPEEAVVKRGLSDHFQYLCLLGGFLIAVAIFALATS